MRYRCVNVVLAIILSLLTCACCAVSSQDIADRRVEATSPDGRYVAVIKLDDAAWVLSVYRRHVVSAELHGKRLPRRRVVLTPFALDIGRDIAGARWCPRRGHTLVFAEDGVYADDARMAIWRRGKRAVMLVPRRLEKDSGQEFFQLDGISRDGKTVYYGYGVASRDKYGAHWVSYKIGLTPDSRPMRDRRNHGYRPPDVFDKSVMAYGH